MKNIIHYLVHKSLDLVLNTQDIVLKNGRRK